jgi:hypothetical protein
MIMIRTTLPPLLVLSIFACIPTVHAQRNPEASASNYSGIQSSLLNPASIADSKLAWDVNILSGGFVFDNDFLFIPKSTIPAFGFGQIFKGAIHANLFYPRFDPQNPNKTYNFTYASDILGPSFQLTIAKKHTLGFTLSARTYSNVSHISGQLAQDAYTFLGEKDLWNTPFSANGTRFNLAGWLDYGFHYATVVFSNSRYEVKGGITFKYLQGLAAAYVKSTRLNYIIQDSAIAFTNTSLEYGRTDWDSYRKVHGFGGLNHGHGFGADLGVELVRKSESSSGPGYLYKLGISLLDLGKINYNRNSDAYQLNASNVAFQSWDQAHISTNAELDRTLSAVFYDGDSARSHVGNHFTMNLPTAISIQADWNAYREFFLHAAIVQSTRNPNRPGAITPDVYELSVRYEKTWFDVSVPFSLLYYGRLQPRIGVAARIYYFYFGMQSPWGILGLKDFDRMDLYAGVHLYVPNKKPK